MTGSKKAPGERFSRFVRVIHADPGKVVSGHVRIALRARFERFQEDFGMLSRDEREARILALTALAMLTLAVALAALILL